MASPLRDHVYRGDGGRCTFDKFEVPGVHLLCGASRDMHERAIVDGQTVVVGHTFLAVAGHPDDDECTYREDDTDETYCGRTREEHYAGGSLTLLAVSPTPVRRLSLSRPSSPQVSPHPWVRRPGWRFWICHHCYAPKSLHPRTEWVRARPLGDSTYYDSTAPHFGEGW